VKKLVNNISIRFAFGNIARDRHVLLVIKDHNGDYLLGEKPDFYPTGICRLVGGGIEKDEAPLDAAIREAREELTIAITEKNLKPVAQVITNAKLDTNNLNNTTFIYLLTGIDDLKLQPNDDIKALKKFSKKDLAELIEKYNNLDDKNLYFGEDGYKHYWNDYGKMYFFIHQVVLDLT